MTSDKHEGIQSSTQGERGAERSPASHGGESHRGKPESDVNPKVIEFDDLTRCGNEVWIRNGGLLYRLQRTRQGKLILTK